MLISANGGISNGGADFLKFFPEFDHQLNCKEEFENEQTKNHYYCGSTIIGDNWSDRTSREVHMKELILWKKIIRFYSKECMNQQKDFPGWKRLQGICPKE